MAWKWSWFSPPGKLVNLPRRPSRRACAGRLGALENNTVEIARRDTLEKSFSNTENLCQTIQGLLEEIQSSLLLKAEKFRKERTFHAKDWDNFKDLMDNESGFVYAHWDGTKETELKIKDATKATLRCIPLENEQEEGICIYSGKPSKQKVIFAKAY